MNYAMAVTEVYKDERLDKTEYAVEADGFSMQCIWEKYCKQSLYRTPQNVLEFEQLNPGRMICVGYVNKRPVIIELYWWKIEGHMIMAYHATSEIVDWPMINKWLDRNCKAPRCDANNFGNVLSLVNFSDKFDHNEHRAFLSRR